MKKNEIRLRQIVEILLKKHRVQIKELADLFNVSQMTIRRDLEKLAYNDVVLDVRGLAVFNSRIDPEEMKNNYSLQDAGRFHLKEKERIGAYAASQIGDGECIIIDNGTTTEKLAKSIPSHLKITVLTTNLNIVNCLADNPNISLVFGGGYYHQDTSFFESAEGINLINKTRANKVYLSAAGVHQTLGVTCANSYELDTKYAFMKSGAEKILLTDSSKFGLIKKNFFAKLDDLNKIITDHNLTEEWSDFIKKHNIDLVTV
ncbi:MAG: DeoR/GlpR family DNA-binding transcription regulator [Synergistaceae bacterium]|nr:DeoR/GlpR family DNA-binding transcription regulator [Synergistaceae bacterium]